ncbi:MAG: GGDEF domain-containing protein [Roseitalea sp.]|jgi:diguanylate cyclase|nr:GGDEF domain-containing protein [Roseitalea sp.]MBO6722001.1 GGDEF domain-containing protein [Roseitalea sp.]MBO6743439.1 GGDEF domain-containing protein [Roseitalea sp.]
MSSRSTAKTASAAHPASGGFDDPFRFAAEALSLAKAHGTPPEPDTFKVWYTYAAGSSLVLNQRIESLIADGTQPSVYDLSALNGEIIEADKSADAACSQAGDSLRKEMEEVQTFIRSYLQTTERYEGTIDDTTKSLSEASTAAEVETVIALMIRENQRVRAQTQQLSASLRETQDEIIRLQDKLSQSRKAEMQDPMTGLNNRRFFQQAIASALAHAETFGQPMSFAIADIDHFKSVNDRFGHQIGDEILKFVGTFIDKKLKEHGTVSRYGGEEFAIILPNITIETARALLEDVKDGIAGARLVTSKSNKPIGAVTVSFGVSSWSEGDDIDGLFDRADRQLYEAKNAGRNLVR